MRCCFSAHSSRCGRARACCLCVGPCAGRLRPFSFCGCWQEGWVVEGVSRWEWSRRWARRLQASIWMACGANKALCVPPCGTKALCVPPCGTKALCVPPCGTKGLCVPPCGTKGACWPAAGWRMPAGFGVSVAVMPHMPSVAVMPRMPSVAVMPHMPSVAVMPRMPSVAVMPHMPSLAVMPHMPSVAMMPDTISGRDAPSELCTLLLTPSTVI